ncbi:MAG: hypothetical protein E5Y59_01750 [Mesorhizobium sp.]|nr:MAG: hypothetical protein E5Y59_01750 [Mesorhizobium sp.]
MADKIAGDMLQEPIGVLGGALGTVIGPVVGTKPFQRGFNGHRFRGVQQIGAGQHWPQLVAEALTAEVLSRRDGEDINVGAKRRQMLDGPGE